MRIDKLQIERYGAFEQRSLALGGAPLTVVYGPNEAGKSTTLEAIGDFLFGIHPQTPRMGIFGGDVLRLGANLTTADGETLTLWRRKGRGKTLTNGAGAALDDAVLAHLLGGTTRQRFETLFGLDHETLRQGGAELLSADGEFGRLIVEAGGGLRGLVARLEQIDTDLAGLFTTRRHSDRAFYRAHDAFVDAERAAKEAQLTWDQYAKDRKAHELAVETVQRLKADRGAAARKLSQLERLVRVVPTLGRLDQVRLARAELGEDLGLPPDFDDQVDRAREALAKAQKALAEDTEQRGRLQETLAALVTDANLQALEAKIRDIRERTVHVRKQRDDRPNRERELAEADARLNGLRRRLGLTPDADLSSKLPAVSVVDAVVALGGQGQRLEPQRAAAAEEVRRLQARQAQLSVAVKDALAAGYDEGVGVTSDQLALLPSTESGLALRERQASKAIEVARAGLRSLGLDADNPETQPFPDAESVGKEIASLERLNDERAEAEKDLRRAEADRDAAVRAAERLTAGGEVADAAALAAAREARGGALEPLRRAHLAGAWSEGAKARALEVQQLDEAIAGADDIADRLSAEAQRAAELAQARYREAENQALATQARRTLDSLEGEIARRVETFRAAYPDACAHFPALPLLKDAAERRCTLIDQACLAAEALEDVERQRVNFSSQGRFLEQVEGVCRLEDDPGLSFEGRVRRAMRGLAQHAEGCSAYARAKHELGETEVLLADAEKRREKADSSQRDWRDLWTPALAALGLPIDTAIDEAIAAANEWAGAAGVLTTIDSTRRRLTRMQEDEDELEAWVKAAFDRLGLERPADTVAAANMLDARWEQHQGASRKRQALEPELKLAETHEKEHADQGKTASAVLESLAALAAVDQAGLDGVCGRLKRRRELLRQEAQLVDSLQAAGDGLSEAALRTDWGARDLDDLRAELRLEEASGERLEPAWEAAVRDEASAQSHLDAHGREPEGAALASREAALSEIHDVVERYVKLSLARSLVETAIGKVRAAQQDPLIARAGAYFAAMSKGAFAAVAADVDAKGVPIVVGLTPAGRIVPVGLMSDGSRDQLYLAFRLAGVEAYCQSAEPLPFVADDILVHFDDERTEATLQVLSEFGKVTQVLLFTHHLSVKRAAEALANTGCAEVVQLGHA